MNIIERSINQAGPVLSARLRVLKAILRKEPTARVIHHCVPRNSVVVDVGAYRGFYTWLLASPPNGRGRVASAAECPRRTHVDGWPSALSSLGAEMFPDEFAERFTVRPGLIPSL